MPQSSEAYPPLENWHAWRRPCKVSSEAYPYLKDWHAWRRPCKVISHAGLNQPPPVAPTSGRACLSGSGQADHCCLPTLGTRHACHRRLTTIRAADGSAWIETCNWLHQIHTHLTYVRAYIRTHAAICSSKTKPAYPPQNWRAWRCLCPTRSCCVWPSALACPAGCHTCSPKVKFNPPDT